MVDVNKLISCFEYPELCAPNYHGDMVSDVIDTLKRVSEIETLNDDKSELFSLLPGDDELDDIKDILSDSLEMNKSEMIIQIKRCIEILDHKTDAYEHTKEYASVTYLRDIE